MADFKATDAELCTLRNKTSRDGTQEAQLGPTWEHPSEIPSGMGSLEFCNDLIDNSSGTTFVCSSAGLNTLCWFGRKDNYEKSHWCLGVPADLPLVAMCRQELCEEGCLAPSLHLQLLVPSHCGASRERRFDSTAGEVIEHFCSSLTILPILSFWSLLFSLPKIPLSITDCYDFTLTACKISKIPCDTNLPKVSAVPNPFPFIIFQATEVQLLLLYKWWHLRFCHLKWKPGNSCEYCE